MVYTKCDICQKIENHSSQATILLTTDFINEPHIYAIQTYIHAIQTHIHICVHTENKYQQRPYGRNIQHTNLDQHHVPLTVQTQFNRNNNLIKA